MWMRRQDGQALVELAISITVLMMILLGIVEFGRIGHAYVVITHASREGARVGVLNARNTSDNSIIDAAVERAVPSLVFDKMDVMITPDLADVQWGDPLTVSIEYPLDLVSPFRMFFQDPFIIQARTVMRVE